MSPYIVAVRTLCEFAAKRGDLDARFAPSPTSEQGIAGHRRVLGSRGSGYQREVAVSGEYGPLTVRGRADGFDRDRLLVEEVKTCTGALDRIPENQRWLHWAQAKVYAALLCRQFELPQITVALVYFDVRRQRELPPLREKHEAEALFAFFAMLCDRFLAWATREAAHRSARDASLKGLLFPFPTFRCGQRDLAKAVFQTARTGGRLLAQAPTGSGKTLATLFPVLKACAGQQIDKVLYLTAKGPGRQLAWSALDTLRASSPELVLRTLDLTARDKACEHPDKRCHGDSCPLANGFYDRLPEARAAAVGVSVLSRAAVRRVALAHSVCPYYLGQEMARWSDVVVADYNHYFDSAALLHGLVQAEDWRAAVLVDEAHNLLERGREMYSASLESARLRAVRARAPTAVKNALDRLQRSWSALARSNLEPYAVLEKPAAFAGALQKVTAAIGEHLADEPAAIDEQLLAFHFDALALSRLLETIGPHSLIDIARPESPPLFLAGSTFAPKRSRSKAFESVLSVRNVVPAPFLAPRFAAAQSAVLFSATLAPNRFYVDCLGLPEDANWIDIPSAFKPEQLSVAIVRNVSTRYRDRPRSIAPIAALIAERFAQQPGNYLVYASSFAYLERIAAELGARQPQIPQWCQRPSMSEAEQEAFLARFALDGCGVAFAVLGGTFAEGVDLVGTRLVGVFVATLGLPQVNDVHEAMRRHLDQSWGCGFDYVYLYPGVRKVIQAAGRVIRSESDRGSVHLIDDRFARTEVLRLLPRWWRIEEVPPRVRAGPIAKARHSLYPSKRP